MEENKMNIEELKAKIRNWWAINGDTVGGMALMAAGAYITSVLAYRKGVIDGEIDALTRVFQSLSTNTNS